MERIVIQVGDDVAKKWRLPPQKRGDRISREINVKLAKELYDSREDFLQFLDELAKKMEKRGLPEEALQEILKDED